MQLRVNWAYLAHLYHVTKQYVFRSLPKPQMANIFPTSSKTLLNNLCFFKILLTYIWNHILLKKKNILFLTLLHLNIINCALQIKIGKFWIMEILFQDKNRYTSGVVRARKYQVKIYKMRSREVIPLKCNVAIPKDEIIFYSRVIPGYNATKVFSFSHNS